MDAVLGATVLNNWQCSDHNGMSPTKDNQLLLLANAITFRAQYAGDFAPPARPPARPAFAERHAARCQAHQGAGGGVGRMDHGD